MASGPITSWEIEGVTVETVRDFIFLGSKIIADSEDELKGFLMKVKEESEKVGLKLNIQKMKIIASSPIASWQINWEKTEVVTKTLFSWAPKSLQMVTAAMKLKDACSLEEKL